MKFLDPLPLDCDACQVKSDYSVADLLAFNAFCVHCGVSLSAIGEKMQASLRAHRIELWPDLFLFEASEIFDLDLDTISDVEFAAIKTVGEFMALLSQCGKNMDGVETKIIQMGSLQSVVAIINIKTLADYPLLELAELAHPPVQNDINNCEH